MSEDKITAEMAEQEFERFAKAWDLDLDTADMDEEDEKSLADAKRPILRGIRLGFIRVDDNGDLEIDLQFGTKAGEKVSLQVNRADLLVMDKYKNKESVHKLNAYVSSLAGESPKFYSRLDPRDQKRIRAPVMLFLAG